jgi:hypothetical protein
MPVSEPELLALSLLCATPSELNQAIVSSTDQPDFAQILSNLELNVSDPQDTNVQALLNAVWQNRTIYQQVGDVLAANVGPYQVPPHPSRTTAQKILDAMQKLGTA